MTFDTLLIANRGEIACRIIDTARRMKLRTVAVYSDADKNARHVRLADAAVRIGPAAPSESYLNMEAILEAAREAGAGAIHPGYGFLSENPDFVDAVEKAGLVFVGPSSEAIRKMGLKDEAKALMEKAGVPVVPGYHGTDQADDVLRRAADDLGFPVLIKAVAGGGGKGMRVVDHADGFADALGSARAEALSAFGNADVLIEKLIPSPRHIEVQIFGDGSNVIHLFERDCSLQRRHQKVIEEAPAPGMTGDMRDAMGTAAVRAANAVGYKGAGTVEFIVDGRDGLRPDRFWFMEMNTRLQVEHPVTEAITGIDLVEWQLRIARGEPLPLGQEDISIRGHAVEARVYAEDPSIGFLPATGMLRHVAFPTNVRIDSGVSAGDAISPHYDPMIAKIIVHATDRRRAFETLTSSVDRAEISGVMTNLGFLSRLSQHSDVMDGKLDTGLIARNSGDLVGATSPSDDIWAVAVATVFDARTSGARGFALWHPLRHVLSLAGRSFAVSVEGDAIRVQDDALDHVLTKNDDGWRIDGDRRLYRSFVSVDDVTVFGPHGATFAIADPLDRSTAAHSDGTVRSPMPGQVTRVMVDVGDDVAKGTPLVTLEAMKMEHTMRATHDGTITFVGTAVGAQVEAGETLVRLAVEESLA